jgi:hypothetical protein
LLVVVRLDDERADMEAFWKRGIRVLPELERLGPARSREVQLAEELALEAAKLTEADILREDDATLAALVKRLDLAPPRSSLQPPAHRTPMVLKTLPSRFVPTLPSRLVRARR